MEESHEDGLLEYPVYTKPAEWRGRAPPPVLLSGDHAAIAGGAVPRALRTDGVGRRPDLGAPQPARVSDGRWGGGAVPAVRGDAAELLTLQAGVLGDRGAGGQTETSRSLRCTRASPTRGGDSIAAGRRSSCGSRGDGWWARCGVGSSSATARPCGRSGGSWWRPTCAGTGSGGWAARARPGGSPRARRPPTCSSPASTACGNLKMYKKAGFRVRGEVLDGPSGPAVLTKPVARR